MAPGLNGKKYGKIFKKIEKVLQEHEKDGPELRSALGLCFAMSLCSIILKKNSHFHERIIHLFSEAFNKQLKHIYMQFCDQSVTKQGE